MEGSLVAYKVFTNGSTLQASEINDNLMRQSVMVFSNAAARTAAITVPLEGMLTWLEDVNRYESYNGSAWVSPFGMTLVATSNFTSQTQIIFDNIFSSQYDNYKIYGSVSGTATTGVNWQLRVGGSSLTSTTYQGVTINGYSSATSTQSAAQANGEFGLVRNSTKRNIFESTLSNPFNTVDTQAYSSVYDSLSNGIAITAFQNTTLASYDGIRIFAGAGNFTGSIQIYGLRK
jgi:hypothetical protein